MEGLAGKAQEFIGSEQGQKLASQYGGQIKNSTGIDVSNMSGQNQQSKGQQGQGENQNQNQNSDSAYDGFGQGDSTSTGGYGRNAGGSAFSRANQMGTAEGSGNDDNYENDTHGGNKTGASTPGYRRDGDDGQDVNTSSQFRGQNLSFTAAGNNDEPEI